MHHALLDQGRADDISIAFDKEGYEPQVVNLTKEVAGTGAAGFAGNILLGGGVGMIVDGVSGAAMDHKPNPVIITMLPSTTPPPAPPIRPKARHRLPVKPKTPIS